MKNLRGHLLEGWAACANARGGIKSVPFDGWKGCVSLCLEHKEWEGGQERGLGRGRWSEITQGLVGSGKKLDFLLSIMEGYWRAYDDKSLPLLWGFQSLTRQKGKTL